MRNVAAKSLIMGAQNRSPFCSKNRKKRKKMALRGSKKSALHPSEQSQEQRFKLLKSLVDAGLCCRSFFFCLQKSVKKKT